MRRRAVQDLNQETKNIKKRINETKLSLNQLNIQIDGNLLNRISSNEPFKAEDISTIGKIILNQNGYNANVQYSVISDFNYLEEFLTKKKQLYDFVNLPLFLVINDNNFNWCLLAFFQFDYKILVFYKNPIGYENDLVVAIIRKCFANQAEINLHTNKEKHDPINNGLICLKNLEIVINILKSNENDLKENFNKAKFCSQTEIENVKDEFKKKLQQVYGQLILNYLQDIQSNEEFKIKLRKLIDDVNQFKEIAQQADLYHNFLMKEIKNKEENSNYKIKKDFCQKYRQELNEKISKINFLENIQFNAENNGEYEHAIANQHPNEYNKFNEIFQYLAKSKCDDYLKDCLEKISQDLEIDLNKLTSFFEFLNENQKESGKNLNLEKDLEKEKKEKFDKIKKQLPKLIRKKENDMKSIDTLLSEIYLGKDDDNIDYNSKIQGIKRKYEMVKENDNESSKMSADDIYNWAKDNRGKIKNNSIFKCISIMDRANELVTGGNRLRDTQILSIIVYLDTVENKGKLCQIQTGEGKTVIVSLLATIKLFMGVKTVDIITSNPVLAIDSVKDRKLFYSLFDISVSTNNLDPDYKKGPRECYSNDIVYGCISNFQFDFLRDSFEGDETRGGRLFDCVILDEVDSMLIDNGGHIAKLSTPFPGMESLRYVYIKIWRELHFTEKQIVQEFLQEFEVSNNKDNVERVFRLNALKKIKERIKNCNLLEDSLIPSYLKSYSENMLDKWIDNAIYAKYFCQQDVEYVIKQVKDSNEFAIIPVDYANTGVSMENTIWSYALHQFLQLKHSLQLTTESLTSSFISNLGYIKMYANNIFGLTGTLGSVAEQSLLSSVYNVDYAKIPTYKEKLFKELDSIFSDDDEWHFDIVLEVFEILKNDRAVLIILESKKDLQEFYEIFKLFENVDNFNEFCLKKYADEEDAEIVDEEVKPHDIILATNLAGRGTDLKTNCELEKNGGLNVIVAFLPCNKRVEEQAFGRTSRQGNHGTAQLIIKMSEISRLLDSVEYIENNLNFKVIKKLRDKAESNRIEYIKSHELKKLHFHDELFSKFSKMYSNLRKENEEKKGFRYVLSDLKQFWAFWLHENQFDGTQSVDKVFEEFLDKSKSIRQGNIVHNPYYCIQQAENFLQSEKKYENFKKIKRFMKHDDDSLNNDEKIEAEKSLRRAIELDKDSGLLYSAYLKMFEIEMEKGKVLMERFWKAIGDIVFVKVNKNENYKKNAKYWLIKAKSSIGIEIKFIEEKIFKNKILTDIISLSEPLSNINKNEMKKNHLADHIYSRFLCLNFYQASIDGLIDIIDKSYKDERGLNINSRIPDYLISMKPQSDDEKKFKEQVHVQELRELSNIGLEIIYSLQEVHDVDETVIKSARVQIVSGISCLAAGVAYPPSFPIMSRLAGMFITEGICDIIIELIKKGHGEFNDADYWKGKMISYGISIITYGISTILACEKILNKAIEMLRNLAELLRKSTIFCSICLFIAKHIEKIIIYLQTCLELAKAASIAMSGVSRLTLALIAIKSIGKELAIKAVGGILIDKLANEIMSKILEDLKPIIKKQVKKKLEQDFDLVNLIVKVKRDQLIEIIKDLLNKKNINLAQVAKEISIGLAKQTSNYKVKIAVSVIDTCCKINELKCFINEFINDLKDKLENVKTSENNNKYTDGLIDIIAELISDRIHNLIIQLSTKATIALCKTAIEAVKKKFESKSLVVYNDAKKLHENLRKAYEYLDLPLDADIKEVKKKYLKLISSIGYCKDKQAEAKLIEIHSAYAAIVNKNPSLFKVEYQTKSYKLLLPANSLENNCVLDNVSEHFIETDASNLSKKTGIFNGGRGSNIEDALIIFNELKLDSNFIQSTLENLDSDLSDVMKEPKAIDRALIFLEGKIDNSLGHCVVVKLNESGQLLVYDQDKSMPLLEFVKNYQNCYGFNLRIVFSKNLKDNKLKLKEELDNYRKHPSFLTIRFTGNKFEMIYGRKSDIIPTDYFENKKNILEDHFYSEAIGKDENIKTIQVINDFKKELNNAVINAVIYQTISNKDKSIYTQHSNGVVPTFDLKTAGLKVSFMVGTLRAVCTDGTEIKLIAISGDNKLITQQRNGTDIFFEYSKNGYKFINIETPKDKPIINIFSKEKTKHTYNKCCALQKLLYYLSSSEEYKDKVVKKENINACEMWYTIDESEIGKLIREKKQYRYMDQLIIEKVLKIMNIIKSPSDRDYSQHRAVGSCDKCKEVLSKIV